jgi:adenosylcobinamide-GDP ribazoletransferase
MRNLRAAIVFLTRIPLPMRSHPGVQAAVPWFPVAGALIGAAVGGAAVGLGELVPPAVAAAVAVVTGVLVTGAFHEDGLADVADAFAGGHDRAARMRILRDPLHGSYGVAALAASLLVRVVAVAALVPSPAAAFATIVAAHTLARAGAVALMATAPVAARDGLGADHMTGLDRRAAVAGVIAGVAIAAVLTGWWVAPLTAAAALAAAAVCWLAVRKIGGASGDVLGAAEQVAECAVLVVATGLVTRWSAWWR